MGRAWIVAILISLFSIVNNFAQELRDQWEIQSDSVYNLVKSNRAIDALPFLTFIDKEIQEKHITKGIPFINYLYRKGVTYYALNKAECIVLFEEVISKFQKDKYTDKGVLINTHFFLGKYYFSERNDKLCFFHLGKSVDLQKEFVLDDKNNLENALYLLTFLESENIKSGSKKYKNQFIEFKRNRNDTINLEYARAYKLFDEETKYQEVLDNIIFKNNSEDNQAQNIYIYQDLMFYYAKKEDYKKSIEFGEKFYHLAQETSNLSDKFLDQYCSIMGNAFYELGDDVRNKNLSIICSKINNEDSIDDYYDILNDLLNIDELNTFSNKFIEFENILRNSITKTGYADNLLSIYSLSLTLYELGKLFTIDDITSQLEFIDQFESNLEIQNLELKKALKAEFYFFSNQDDKLQKVCKSYNRTDNNELNLMVYFLQTMSDEKTKPKKPNGLKLFLKEIELCNCIEQPKYLRYYSALVSGVLNEEETYKWANKALTLLETHKLNHNEQGINLQIEIAKQFAQNKSSNDALKIYLDIYNNLLDNSVLSNPFAKVQVLYGIAEIYLVSENLKEAKKYIDELENITGDTSETMKILIEGYQNSLKMRYSFRSKEYLNHIKTYESIELKDDYFQVLLKDLEAPNYILSKYFLNNNIDNTIEDFQDLFSKKPDLRIAILLFQFQLIKDPNNPNVKILLEALDREYNSFQSKGKLLNRNEFVLAVSEMQRLIEQIHNFLPFLNKNQLSQLLKIDNDIEIWNTLQINRNIENEQFLQNSEKINSIRQRIEKELEKTIKNSNLIDSLNFEVNTLERKVSLYSEKLIELGFKPIDNYFKSNDVYVEYIQTSSFYNEISKNSWNDPNLFAIIKSKNNPPIIVDLKTINASIIEKLKFSFDEDIHNENHNLQDDFVWNIMVKPLYKLIKDFDNLYIKNNSVLGYINLEALNIPNTSNLMIDKFNIKRVDALYKLSKQTTEIHKVKSIVLFGNPDFEIQKNSKNEKRTVGSIKDIKLRYLSGAREEIRLIDEKAKEFGLESSLFDFTNASESNFKANNHYDIIHIATHAYDLSVFETENDRKNLNIFGVDDNQAENNYFGYKNKGLFFSGSQKTIDTNNFTGFEDNGILNGNEITNIDLSGTKLVVLSACNTIDNTGKGFTNSGLDKAFLMAGAQEVLATLWDIDDQKTQEFMVLFYDFYFSNSDAEEALFKTKKKFRSKYPEPYYWAPFVLVK
jgi:CHAT domain-containing protein